jgi:hypothetical protein
MHLQQLANSRHVYKIMHHAPDIDFCAYDNTIYYSSCSCILSIKKVFLSLHPSLHLKLEGTEGKAIVGRWEKGYEVRGW